MAWPNNPSGQYTANGVASIKWGTHGMMSYIVKSVSSKDIIERIPIENGTGLIATKVLLWQGREIDITLIDDPNITTPPGPDTVVTLIDPMSNVSTNVRVIDNNYNAARKQEGERVIKAEVLWTRDNVAVPNTAALS